MNGADLQHRLAANLAADVNGYSRLMDADDRATVAALDAARAVFRTHIESHQGRVIDMAGDSVLAAFQSATGAVLAALAVQDELGQRLADVAEDRRMRFRIGIHLGDVIEKADGTVYGDGVNIAARLEGLADPGSVTVSESVRTAVRSKVRADFVDQGEQTVKNIPDPVRAYKVGPLGAVAATSTHPVKPSAPPRVAVPAVAATPEDAEPRLGPRSVAVLPFAVRGLPDSLSFLCESLVGGLIFELSRQPGLTVVALGTMLTFLQRRPPPQQLAHELSVRFVVDEPARVARRDAAGQRAGHRRLARHANLGRRTGAAGQRLARDRVRRGGPAGPRAALRAQRPGQPDRGAHQRRRRRRAGTGTGRAGLGAALCPRAKSRDQRQGPGPGPAGAHAGARAVAGLDVPGLLRLACGQLPLERRDTRRAAGACAGRSRTRRGAGCARPGCTRPGCALRAVAGGAAPWTALSRRRITAPLPAAGLVLCTGPWAAGAVLRAQWSRRRGPCPLPTVPSS